MLIKALCLGQQTQNLTNSVLPPRYRLGGFTPPRPSSQEFRASAALQHCHTSFQMELCRGLEAGEKRDRSPRLGLTGGWRLPGASQKPRTCPSVQAPAQGIQPGPRNLVFWGC